MDERISKAISEYNKYRYPEAMAKVIKEDGDLIFVKFDGSFWETYGLYDWIDDLKYVLLEMGIESEIIKIEGSENEYSRIGIFRLKNKINP